jgi:hypothetical protein
MRTHPEAVEVFIPTWGYYCAECGGLKKLGWYAPTDEKGERLYCVVHAPQREGADGRWPEPAFWWCRHGQHVVTERKACHKIGHPEPKPELDRTRSCERCGEEFTPKRSDARYCSVRCRVAAHREKKTMNEKEVA